MTTRNEKEFRFIVRAALDKNLLDIEVEAKIAEAYRHVHNYCEKQYADKSENPVKKLRLSGPGKDEKISKWYKLNKAFNRIKIQPYFTGRTEERL